MPSQLPTRLPIELVKALPPASLQLEMLLVGSSAVVEPFPGSATLMQSARGDPAAFEIVHKLPSSMGFYRCPLYAIHNIMYSPSVTLIQSSTAAPCCDDQITSILMCSTAAK